MGRTCVGTETIDDVGCILTLRFVHFDAVLSRQTTGLSYSASLFGSVVLVALHCTCFCAKSLDDVCRILTLHYVLLGFFLTRTDI